MKKVKVNEKTGCWEWQGARNPKNYGMFRFRGTTNLAHRVSFTLFKSEIHKGLLIMHSCDNPCCVNPSHLAEGTGFDNQRDASLKGRFNRKGEASNSAKITNADVRVIRASHRSSRDICRDYGLTKSAIQHIRQGRSWSHVV